MTRTHLQWNDERPDLYRARGRSERLYRIGRDGPAEWWLRVTAPGQRETEMSRGMLEDMKALANIDEADAAPAVTAQRIAWVKIRDGHWWGTSKCGPAYKASKVGRICGETIWRLESYANEDSEFGYFLDEGPLAAMKRRAARHAGEEAAA